MAIYEVVNRQTKERIRVQASSAHTACEAHQWPMAECHVYRIRDDGSKVLIVEDVDADPLNPESLVHPYTAEDGRRRWAVAQYVDGLYRAPVSAGILWLHRRGDTWVAGSLEEVIPNAYTYARRGDALRRARREFMKHGDN